MLDCPLLIPETTGDDMDGKWISYLRVSTDRQGKSGLGIEAQRNSVAEYLNGGNWKLVKEFVEVESGKRTDRPMLEDAVKACRAYGAKLVIAKLDRLSRDAHFLLGLEKAGIDWAPNSTRAAGKTKPIPRRTACDGGNPFSIARLRVSVC